METTRNFLPQDEFNKLVELITDNEFDWYLSEKVTVDIDSPISGLENSTGHKQFTHTFCNHLTKSRFMDRLSYLFNAIGAKKIYRAKVNLAINSGRHEVGGWHYDSESIENARIAVLYLNTNNGYTILGDGSKVGSEENKLVVFSNDILHTGVSQTDTNERYLINIVFE